jgi:hypothetical protein
VLATLRAGWKFPITHGESDEELHEMAVAFNAEVDAEVAKTYAMRLTAPGQ